MGILAQELEILDRLEDGHALDTVTNIWATVTGWLNTYVWAALVLLLLLIGGTYLLSVGRRTRT